jgi:hypothetical protein
MIVIEKAAFALAALAISSPASASDTVNYTYDALGRLTDISVSGGPNAGSAAATDYDPAGNRTGYTVSGMGPAGQGAASQSSSAGEMVTGLDEEGIVEQAVAEDVPPARVEPPPPGGIPDESEPAVESEPPEGAADDQGADR